MWLHKNNILIAIEKLVKKYNLTNMQYKKNDCEP